MKIGLIDVDSHNFPNLCLMKISAWHKSIGDEVEWWDGFAEYDRVYISRVFDDVYSPEPMEPVNAKEIIRGGTGYDLKNVLPPEIEHVMPDYSLYYDRIPETRYTAYGFLTRGCPRHCPFCIVGDKEGLVSRKVSDLSEWWNGQKEIKLLDPNLLASKDHLDLIRQLAESKAKIDFTQGLDARLLAAKNIEALNQCNTKMIHFAWDMMEFSDSVERGLRLYAKLGGVENPRNRRVYVLVNFNTTMEENLYRVKRIFELGFDPYVMVYNKPTAPQEVKDLQRWVNNKFIFRACPDFEKYKEMPKEEREELKIEGW